MWNPFRIKETSVIQNDYIPKLTNEVSEIQIKEKFKGEIEQKNVKFPSILEQLETKFPARVELDKTILKVLDFSDKEINEWLPKVYDALVEELKAMKGVK